MFKKSALKLFGKPVKTSVVKSDEKSAFWIYKTFLNLKSLDISK
jgi:hypothetical protein